MKAVVVEHKAKKVSIEKAVKVLAKIKAHAHARAELEKKMKKET